MKRSCYLLTGLLLISAIFSVSHAQIPLLSTHIESLPSGETQVNIIRWDARTGSIMSSKPTTYSTFLTGSSFYNASAGRYCFRANRDSFSGFILFDVGTRSVSQLSGTDVISTAIEADMSNGNTYVLVPDDNSNKFVLSQYNFLSASVDSIATLNDVSTLFLDANCYNSNQGILYLIANDNNAVKSIFSIDVRNNGAITKRAISGIDLPLSVSLEYNNNNNKLYALYTASEPLTLQSSIQIAEIDPSTGAVMLLKNLPQYKFIGQSSQTFDQSSSSLVFIAIDSLLNHHLNIYNVLNDSLTAGVLPAGIIPYNIEADNLPFALRKYGPVVDSTPTLNNTFTVYPVPTRDLLQVSASGQNAVYYVYDRNGRLVRQISNLTGTTINVSMLQPGSYFIKRISDGKEAVRKFIKL